MHALDETHDRDGRSFVASANQSDCDFPIQNLPFGVFKRRHSQEAFRVGVAIGDQIFDLSRIKGVFHLDAMEALDACGAPSLNPLMALDPECWDGLRREIWRVLRENGETGAREAIGPHLVAMRHAEMKLPVQIGDFTDFYASVFHAANAGRLMRPNNPLLPNYKYVPIAYHSRSSSVRVSGVNVRRPRGQVKPSDADAPSMEASARLDYEAELGAYIGTPSELGTPIPIGDAARHVFGFSLLNDWSARDLQVWEYQPLGPFLAKNFASTIAPWVVTARALAPYRTCAFVRPEGDPAPLPYLMDAEDQRLGGLDINIRTFIATARMRETREAPHRLSSGWFSSSYWTVAQMVAHHTSNGCNLATGDLLGSGTISGPSRENWGSLLELTHGGARPLELPNGETRSFLEDGDEIILRGRCEKAGAASLGFGECRAMVLPSPAET
jgi:fumarylacetoacetase